MTKIPTIKIYEATIKGTFPDLNTEINEAKRVITVGKGIKRRKIPGLLYSNHKKKWTKISKDQCAEQIEPLQLNETCSFVITWYCKNRRKDCDNIAFAEKYIFDGLSEAGILKGDGWRVTNGGISHCFEIDKENPRAEVLIVVGAKTNREMLYDMYMNNF